MFGGMLFLCPTDVLLLFWVDEAFEKLLEPAQTFGNLFLGSTCVLFGFYTGFDGSRWCSFLIDHIENSIKLITMSGVTC